MAVYEDRAVALMNFRDEKGEPSELIASLEGFAEMCCGSLEGIRTPDLRLERAMS